MTVEENNGRIVKYVMAKYLWLLTSATDIKKLYLCKKFGKRKKYEIIIRNYK